MSVKVVLRPISTTAIVAVRAPSGSEVFIDEHPAGPAPAEAQVEPGRHHVRARASGYRDAEATVVVAAGERRLVELEPTHRVPVVAQWWFWTGVGVAVVATTLVFTLERPADSGENFSPGRISGPLTVEF